MSNAKRDQNFVPGLLGVSSDDGTTLLPVEIEPLTGRVKVEATGTITGTQYTEGDTDATVTGNAILGEGTSDTLKVVKTDDDGHLQVDVLSGGGGGTQYTEGDSDATITGTAMMYEDADTLRAATGDVTNGIDVDVTRVNGTVTVSGTVQSQPSNTISTNNSTTSTLAGGNTYTGTGDDLSNYSSVTIQLDASHDSATDGMTFQFSIDNTNWDDMYTHTYTAADGARQFQFPVTAQYFRIVYTNGASAQTHFRVQTILHGTNVLNSVHRISDSVSSDKSAGLVTAALIAQVNGTGDFTPIQSTAGGILKIGGSVGIDSSALPTGAATEANQTTIIGHVDGIEALLTGIDTDTAALAAAVSGSEMQVDIVGALPAGTNAIGKLSANDGVDIGDVSVNNTVTTDHAITNLADGVTTVTTAGTDVVLASSTTCKKVTIQAQTDNTGLIAVGNAGVDATEATGTGIILYPGDSYEFEINNLNKIYIDSTVNGEGVRYTYFT